VNKSTNVFNLIILGDPGSGKATQAARFAKKYRMYDFDMGRELTLLRKKNAALERVQTKTADRGYLTPSHIVQDILKKKILQTPGRQGILFDGHPKMAQEGRLVYKLLNKAHSTPPLVIYLKISTAEVIKRTAQRKGYNKTQLSKRLDDTAEGLRNRAAYYRKNIKAVIKFFKSKYKFVTISGMGTQAQVHKRIQKAIDSYLKHV